MGIFSIILIALWVFPILAVIASRSILKKRVLSISLYLASVIIFGVISGLSTRWDELDCFLIFTLYFSLLTLLLHFYSFKNIVVKVLAGFLLAFSLIVGYVSGSVGLLGVGLILNDFKVERTVYLSGDLVYKQYSLGSAPGDYRGIKLSIVKRPVWLPGLEYNVFTKTYNREYLSPHYSPTNTAAYPTLYSDDFEVKYNISSKTIILMDTITRDTINLK